MANIIGGPGITECGESGKYMGDPQEIIPFKGGGKYIGTGTKSDFDRGICQKTVST